MITMILCTLITGCTFSAGVGLHAQSYDTPDVNMSAGVGVVQGVHKFKDTNITGVCQHVSGLDTNERNTGGGFNGCFALIPLEF